jgi:uncharacterized repeat protein (TIGR01451 family)
MRFTSTLVLAVLGLVLLLPATGYAEGTPAGTQIKNVAKLNYKDAGGNSFAELRDSVTVTVEQVAALAISPSVRNVTSSDSTLLYYPITLVNTGNGTDNGITIGATSTQGWTTVLYVDTDGDGVLDLGEPVYSGPSNIAADDSLKLIATVFVPLGTASGTIDTVKVTATSGFDNAVTATSNNVSTISTADVAATKSNNNATPQPGQTITYTLNFTNSGTGTATGAVLRDTLDANVTYVGGSFNILSGGGSYTFNSGVLTWTIGSIAGGGTGQATFQVTVDDPLAAGTVISNRATIAYTDSLSNRTEEYTTPSSNSTVAQDASWAVYVEPPSAGRTNQGVDSVNVGLSVQFTITLVNTGNAADTATTSASSSLPLTWAYYRDSNNNGVYDAGTDAAYTFGTNLDNVAAGDSVKIFGIATVPTLTPDRSVDSVSYSFTSLTAGASASGLSITTVKAPVMAIGKSVSSTGNRTRPGDTLTYTITYTNTGSGSATQVVITDAQPMYTTYVAGSVQVNNSTNGNVFVAKTDGVDADEASVVSGNVTVNLGTVGGSFVGDPTYTGQIRFKVVIN